MRSRSRAASVAALGLLLCAPPATAEEEEDNPEWFPGGFSANVNFANDYPFRAISQTNENPAIQGGLDWAYDITEGLGVYVGSWGSNVDFGDGDQAQMELDVYGGVSGSIDDFSWDATVIYYKYPGAKDRLNYDYIEFGPKVGYDFGVASTSFQWLWSPNYFGHSGDSHYLIGGVAVPIELEAFPPWLSVSVDGNLGYQDIAREKRFGTSDYWLWDLGTTISLFKLDVDLRYVDTDLSRYGCFGGTQLCRARFLATVGMSF